MRIFGPKTWEETGESIKLHIICIRYGILCGRMRWTVHVERTRKQMKDTSFNEIDHLGDLDVDGSIHTYIRTYTDTHTHSLKRMAREGVDCMGLAGICPTRGFCEHGNDDLNTRCRKPKPDVASPHPNTTFSPRSVLILSFHRCVRVSCVVLILMFSN